MRLCLKKLHWKKDVDLFSFVFFLSSRVDTYFRIRHRGVRSKPLVSNHFLSVQKWRAKKRILYFIVAFDGDLLESPRTCPIAIFVTRLARWCIQLFLFQRVDREISQISHLVYNFSPKEIWKRSHFWCALRTFI